MQIRKFDPATGMAFQGDVAIVPMPADIAIARTDEIAPIDGRLILQEGEVTGHHHAIRLRHFRETRAITADPALAITNPKLRRAFGSTKAKEASVPIARMFRDPAAVNELVRRRILARADLAVGCLVVEGGPVTVAHEEHDAIELPPGNYYVGRQVESAGAEERVVSD